MTKEAEGGENEVEVAVVGAGVFFWLFSVCCW
jgi:hypothetical protein